MWNCVNVKLKRKVVRIFFKIIDNLSVGKD